MLGTVRQDDGLELLQEAVAVAEASPARLEHAKALIALGAAMRRTGRAPTRANRWVTASSSRIAAARTRWRKRRARSSTPPAAGLAATR